MNFIQLKNYIEDNKGSPTWRLAYALIGDDGVAEIAPFVRDSVFVKHLDLRGNNIQAKGCAVLASSIKFNRSLRSVNLKCNSVGNDNSGIQALCDVLKANMTITHLLLRDNKISNVGAKHLADMLKSNTTITHLDVSWNDFGVDGGAELIEGVKNNNNLIACQLAGSKVGEDILNEVSFHLRRNRAAAAYRGGSPPSSAPQGATAGDSVAGVKSLSSADRDLLEDFADRPKAPLSKNQESALLLRIMIMEREQVQADDKLFFQQVEEHIDQCKLQSIQHKQACVDAEEREKLATSDFLSREPGYNEQISTVEENLKQTVAERVELMRERYPPLAAELKRSYEENAQAMQEAVAAQEHAMALEEALRKEYRDIVAEKRMQQDKLALGQRDLDLLFEENARLRAHVKVYKTDSKSSMMGQVLD